MSSRPTLPIGHACRIEVPKYQTVNCTKLGQIGSVNFKTES